MNIPPISECSLRRHTLAIHLRTALLCICLSVPVCDERILGSGDVHLAFTPSARFCSSCGKPDPKFGTHQTRLWDNFFCRSCADRQENATTLAKRCWQCSTMAIFGPKVILPFPAQIVRQQSDSSLTLCLHRKSGGHL